MDGHVDSGDNSFPWQIRSTYGPSHEPIVDYIVLAEFDIDTGSTVRHQYPEAIPGCTADWLAENMLPEGVHNRSEDWTYMFLNRECSRLDQRLSGLAPAAAAGAAPPESFLYGVSLVRNKKDDTVRRGAIVKAMAIFSRYSFIEAFRGPLIMALDQYYRRPGAQTVREFFDSLRANIPLAQVPCPTLTEQLLMRRGVVAGQVALGAATDAYLPDAWTFGTKVTLSFSADTSADTSAAAEALDFTVPLCIPLYRVSEEVGDTDLFLALRLLGPDIMRVFHAIITRQRVLFVGYNHAARDIAQVLFSCVSLVTPPLVHNNILKRVFPYANLSDLTFLEHAGYIAGVTNPMFQSRYEWWDLLCVLDLPAKTCRVFSPAERRVEDGVQPPAPPRAHHAHNPTHPNERDGVGATGGDAGVGSGSSSSSSSSSPPAAGSGSASHAAMSATQAAVAARLHQEELVAHEHADLKFITGVLQAVAVAGRELGQHWVKQQFADHCNNIVLQAMDSLYSSNRLVSKKLRRYSFRSNVGHNSLQKSYRLSERTRRMFSANSHRARVLADYMYARAGGNTTTVASSSSSVEAARAAAANEGADGFTESGENAKFAEEFAVGTDTAQLPVYEGGAHGASPGPTTTPATSATSAAPGSGGKEHVFSIVQMYLLRLLYESELHPLLEMQAIFAYVHANCTGCEEECQALLSMLPESAGGLGVLANGALHSNPAVRLLTVQICDRLLQYPSTRPAVTALNGFHRAAVQRQRVAMEDGALLEDAEHCEQQLLETIAALKEKRQAHASTGVGSMHQGMGGDALVI